MTSSPHKATPLQRYSSFDTVPHIKTCYLDVSGSVSDSWGLPTCSSLCFHCCQSSEGRLGSLEVGLRSSLAIPDSVTHDGGAQDFGGIFLKARLRNWEEKGEGIYQSLVALAFLCWALLWMATSLTIWWHLLNSTMWSSILSFYIKCKLDMPLIKKQTLR